MGEMAPAFQFYARDFIVSTTELTDEQEGVYIRLLAFAWDRGGLPMDESRIQRLRPWPDDVWQRCWPELRDRWVRRGDRLVNLRQERERTAQEERRKAAAKGGKAGSQTRAAQRLRQVKGKSTCDSVATDEQVNANTASAFALAKDLKTSTTSLPPPPPDFDPTAYSHGQLKAGVRGLVGAWNNIVAAVIPEVKVDPGASSASMSRALAAHPDIAWWSDVFSAYLQSDYLTGRDGKHAPMTIWSAVDKAEEILGGKFRDRKLAAPAAPPPPAEPRPPYYRTLPTAAEGKAALQAMLAGVANK